MGSEDERVDGDGWEEGEGAFAWEWRVMAVAAFWTLPGVLFGALARLCVTDGGSVWWWIAGGGLLAAIAGGLLESEYWP